MRIAFLVNRDVESNAALNLLLPALAGRVTAVFLSEKVGGAGTGAARLLGQLAYLEQDLFNDLAFPLLECRASPKDRWATFGEIESRFGIPIQVLASARKPEALERLAGAGADLFVSIRFGKILGAEAIAIPRRGVLNLHSGLLPQYRGVLATFRALANGDSAIGCTLHWIDSPAIDEGAIVSTARLAVDRQRSLWWHILSLYPLGASLVLDAIGRLEAGEVLPTVPQSPSSGGYYSFPGDDDLIRFIADGWRLFDREDVADLLARYGLGPGSAPA